MSSYKPYPAYKDSEVECLGQIPTHWANVLLKYYFEENKEKNKGNIEPNVLSLSYGKVISKQGKENFGLIPESFETYQIINKDYLIFRFTDLQNDHKSLRVGYSSQRGIITSAYLGLKAKGRDVDTKFYYYLFHSLDVQKYFYGFGGGVRLSLDWSTLSKIKYPLPPKSEQTAIAHFLDQKTAEVKKFIALKERTINLLQERKQAIINQAVTKGLDPNEEMKDSGLEWLGKIPKHWKQFKIGHISKKVSIKGVFNPVLLSVEREKGVILRSESIDNWNIIPEDLSGYKLVKVGNLVLNKMKTWQGSLGVSNHEGVVSPAYIVLELNATFDIRFLHHQLRSRSYINEYNRISYGVRPDQWDMHFEDFKQIPILIPSESEQRDIIEYIDCQFQLIDLNISQTEKEIALIKEYQQSLIGAAITGKIDVREFAASYPEAEEALSIAAEDEGTYSSIKS